MHSENERWDDDGTGVARSRTIAPIRIPPGREHSMIVLSTKITGAWTHFNGRRSNICAGKSCKMCETIGPPRWYGYVCTLAPKTGNKHLVEFTPRCLDPIQEWTAEHGQLRGAVLVLWREGTRINSPLAARCHESTMAMDKLPQPFDVREKLRVLWGLSVRPAGQTRLDDVMVVEPIPCERDLKKLRLPQGHRNSAADRQSDR